MMIELDLSRPGDRDGDTIVLGRVRVDGVEGDLVYVGRTPHMRGPKGMRELPGEDYNLALAERLDEVAVRIWGNDWSKALADLAGLNTRTTARDRIRKNGLPPDIVRAVVRLSERDDARELSGVVRAMARYIDVHGTLARSLDGNMADAFRSVHGVLADFRSSKSMTARVPTPDDDVPDEPSPEDIHVPSP